MRLEADYFSIFKRDIKRLQRKHIDTAPLRELIELVLENTVESKEILRQRHRMHMLRGEWLGSYECHVANAGDWLVIWRESETVAYFQRTGTHDELFR